MSTRKARRLWPPYRLPSPVDGPYNDPRRILACRTFHGVLFTLLYKALYDSSYTENMLSLSIYLLELAIDYQSTIKDGGNELASKTCQKGDCPDGFFYMWYSSDDIFKNCTSVINSILLNNSITFHSESGGTVDIEMEEVDGSEPGSDFCLPPAGVGASRPLASGSEVVPYQNEASAVVLASSDCSVQTESMEHSQVRDTRPVYHSRRNNALPAAAGGPCANTSVLPSNYPEDSTMKALVDSGQRDESSLATNMSQVGTNRQRGASDEYLNINESLITLLLKLHSKLSDRRGSYRPNFTSQAVDSRIGDGPFFIAKVLNKLGRDDEEAKQCILESINKLYPEVDEGAVSSSDEENSSRFREEKKKRAKEWQRKVMASFNRKQQKFLAKNMADMMGKDGDSSEPIDDDEQGQEKEYDCVICNQSIPSTFKRPFGLIVYMQPTSVHGSRTTNSKGFDIPRNERTRGKIRSQRYTLSRHMKNRSEIFNQYFDLVHRGRQPFILHKFVEADNHLIAKHRAGLQSLRKDNRQRRVLRGIDTKLLVYRDREISSPANITHSPSVVYCLYQNLSFSTEGFGLAPITKLISSNVLSPM